MAALLLEINLKTESGVFKMDKPGNIHVRIDKEFYGNKFDDAREIGCFSIHEDKLVFSKEALNNDSSKKKYYFRRTANEAFNFDLNTGYYDNFKLPSFTDDKIDNVLEWITVEKFQPVMSKDCVDFVTSRGTISKLLQTPYPFCKKDNHWTIIASKMRNTIYFVAFDPEKKETANSQRKETNLKKSYWGRKFEQFMTTYEPNVAPDMTAKCYDSGIFCMIATNKIGPHKLLFRAEMDALDLNPKNSPGYPGGRYVEIKTLQVDEHNIPSWKFMQIWSQCVVVGVEYVVCGYRDDSGILKWIAEHKINYFMEKYQYKLSWSPQKCFNFCNYFLDFLKDNLKDDYTSVMRFDYTGDGIIKYSLEKDERYRIIPEEFAENFFSEETVPCQ